MKIKTVCDMTGLTDRTVRYYIEEQLISPAYTENYLGRKSFDFNEADIQQLKDISVLRKFGFSIAEIKVMHSNPNQISPIVQNLRQRKQIVIDEEQTLLKALLQLEENHCYSLSELAKCLSAPVVNEAIPPEDSALNIRKMIVVKLKALLLATITWMPVVSAITGSILIINHHAYPVFSTTAFILLLVTLTPSFFMILLPKLRFRIPRKYIAKTVLSVLCIFSIPFSFLFGTQISSHSETSDIRNYRRFDSECSANMNSFFLALFPEWPHYSIGNEKQPDGSWNTVYRNTQYLYRKLPAMDYTYDVYAEWRLGTEEFQKEVSRVKTLYDIRATNYATVQTENYVCFIHSFGAPTFEKVTDSYTYYIFAYNEKKRTVRYIWCESLENGADQPYYLSLDW